MKGRPLFTIPRVRTQPAIGFLRMDGSKPLPTSQAERFLPSNYQSVLVPCLMANLTHGYCHAIIVWSLVTEPSDYTYMQKTTIIIKYGST